MTITQEITVQQAARRTHRSPETIRRWIWSGRLPATKRGNTYYIDVNELGLVAEISDESWHAEDSGQGGAAAGSGDLQAWLEEVDQWKSGLPAATSASAADLVIEDRHARR
jgi:excisionase family DNA binding protein